MLKGLSSPRTPVTTPLNRTLEVLSDIFHARPGYNHQVRRLLFFHHEKTVSLLALVMLCACVHSIPGPLPVLLFSLKEQNLQKTRLPCTPLQGASLLELR